MSSTKINTVARVREADPTWEIAHLFPAQGAWSEEEYLALPGNRLVEFSNGYLEVLPMPTTSHQALVAYLYGLLLAFVSRRDLGKVFFAPLRVRLQRSVARASGGAPKRTSQPRSKPKRRRALVPADPGQSVPGLWDT